MTGQYVRWPALPAWPKVLLGATDIEGWGHRYLHLGPLVFAVEHQHAFPEAFMRQSWTFRVASRSASVKVRL